VTAPHGVNEAFRELQAGHPDRALALARSAVQAHPHAPRARLAEGVALRMLARLGEASQALVRAAELDPRDHAIAYETGVVQQLRGDMDGALAQFERARELNPGFFPAHFSAGSLRLDRREWDLAAERFRAAVKLQPRQGDALRWLARALVGGGRHEEAEQVFVHALAHDPHDFNILRTFGQYAASRANFKRAGKLFAEALRVRPGDDALPIFIAQVELLQGHWDAAWTAYREREPRRQLERSLASQRSSYHVPTPAQLAGREVCLIAEQGYGDILFFLRWAPLAVAAGATLRFLGQKGILPLLARTGLFESVHEFGDPQAPGRAMPLLVGDLPAVFAETDPLSVPSLRIAPRPERLTHWRHLLGQAGRRPWIGVTWRAGLGPDTQPHGLYKAIPSDLLLTRLAPHAGTVVAVQRAPLPGEIEAASHLLDRPLHDFSRMNDDLEDAIALVALLDRHVGVSNTNMHLAAAAGATADVLIPFPPEWRWRLHGDSPWFPGFRVHRQTIDGDWSAALDTLVSAPSGNRFPA